MSGREQVFRTPVVLMAAVLFLTTLLVQVVIGVVWSTTADPLRWLLFSVVFTAAYVVLWRPWVRVGAAGLRAGHGPFTRETLGIDAIVVARPHDAGRGPGWRWWRRDPRDTDMYPGWGPAVVVERADGSRLVVGVPDLAGTLTAMDAVGVPVSHRSG